MPAYKDKGNGSWQCKFRSYDWKGTMKYITKRGFASKHDAQEYERQFKLKSSGSTSMNFSDFSKLYLESMKPRIKESTYGTKLNIITHQLEPTFGNYKMNEITTSQILRWQNDLLSYKDSKTGKKYSMSFLKTIHNQLSAIFNFGIRFYGLHDNPAAKVGNMGNDKEVKINFWTTDEYMRFSNEIMSDPLAYYCFEMLYWTGIREGELMALTRDDINLEKRTVSITKTYHHINGHDVITSPKTRKSVRIVEMPQNLCDELQDYFDMYYSLHATTRLFPVSKTYLYNKLAEGAKSANLKKIRVHDLRHSHISMLINMGFSAVAIADRVGHESITITYRYSHLFPSVQETMSKDLNKAMEGKYVAKESR